MTRWKLLCSTLNHSNAFPDILQFLKKQVSDKMWPEKTEGQNRLKKTIQRFRRSETSLYCIPGVQRGPDTRLHMILVCLKKWRICRSNCSRGETESRWVQKRQSNATFKVSLPVFSTFFVAFSSFLKTRKPEMCCFLKMGDLVRWL